MGLRTAKMRNQWQRFRLRGRSLPPLAQANLAALDRLDPAGAAKGHRYVVVDLETTGLNPVKDRVVSVGAFRVVEGRVRLGEVFAELANPGRDMPVESIKVHGIVPDMIRDARPAWEVFDSFLDYLGEDILVAHYAPFDLHFLNRVMRIRYGFPLQNLVLDTVALARFVYYGQDPYGRWADPRVCSLDALAGRYGLEVPERHTALGDALTTALVFQRLMRHLEGEGFTSLAELIKLGTAD